MFSTCETNPMPSVVESLTKLFLEFETEVQKCPGANRDHRLWAERAFLAVMGEESTMDEEDQLSLGRKKSLQ